MNRKAVIFLADGMADEPLEELGGKTPLEAVDTPAMDSIAKRGVSGTFLTLPEGLPTSSDVANMSVLGYYPEKNYPGRGPIEAVSQGIRLADDDVARLKDWLKSMLSKLSGLVYLGEDKSRSHEKAFAPMRDYLSRADLQKKSFFLKNVDLAI